MLFSQAGIRFTCPEDKIYVPGFFCQLSVKIMTKLNISYPFSLKYFGSLWIDQIYRHEITQVCQTGIVLKCPGLFEGELIVAIDEEHKSVVFAMSASKPDFEAITSIFHELVETSFPQCILLFLLYFIDVAYISEVLRKYCAPYASERAVCAFKAVDYFRQLESWSPTPR